MSSDPHTNHMGREMYFLKIQIATEKLISGITGPAQGIEV